MQRQKREKENGKLKLFTYILNSPQDSTTARRATLSFPIHELARPTLDFLLKNAIGIRH